MAAALSRSRGVAGVRSTKGLFFIFTLLSPVCLTSSLIDKEQLEKLKEQFQTIQQEKDNLKATYKSEMATASELLSQSLSLLDSVTGLTHEFPPLEEIVENAKGLIEKNKAYVDKKTVEFGARIEDSEQKLGKIQKLIKFLEGHQVEL